MRKNNNVPISVEQAIVGLIRSLPYFEADYISLIRYPGSIEKERIHTFQQYIECRINNEFYNIPEIRDIVENFDGYLISVTQVSEVPGKKNRFSEIRWEINEYNPNYNGEDLEVDIQRLREFLGGLRFIVRSAPRVPDIIIE